VTANSLSSWSRVCRDKSTQSGHGPRPKNSLRGKPVDHTSRRLGVSRRLGDAKIQKFGFKIIRVSVSANGPCTVNSLRYLNPIRMRMLY
jgi:hypothetical protein